VINIPYASEPRPDTGVSNATLGMWLFIASEVMLFGSLFSSYALLRIGAVAWPDQSATLNVSLAAVNTAILVASSVAIMRASRAAAEGVIRGFRQAMGVTLLCGVAFLAIKAVEYRGELLAGLLPSTNNFIGLYFTLTGLHALHVAAGLVVNGSLWIGGAALARTDASRFVSRVQMAALYWNFIDLIWITMFVVLYLL
jgi:heme/copper-type cytochrome/quinol oxidase subunit 3